MIRFYIIMLFGSNLRSIYCIICVLLSTVQPYGMRMGGKSDGEMVAKIRTMPRSSRSDSAHLERRTAAE